VRKLTLEILVDQPEGDWVWDQFGKEEPVRGMAIVSIHSGHVLGAVQVLEDIKEAVSMDEVELPRDLEKSVFDFLDNMHKEIMEEVQGKLKLEEEDGHPDR
jgi:hypothetical protein